MPGFVQIMEIKTSQIDEVEDFAKRMQKERGDGLLSNKATITADRDRPGYYFIIVEFDSYERAMENSNDPETEGLREPSDALGVQAGSGLLALGLREPRHRADCWRDGEPESDRRHHRGHVAERADADVTRKHACEQHEDPCAHEEHRSSRCQLEEVPHAIPPVTGTHISAHAASWLIAHGPRTIHVVDRGRSLTDAATSSG
jgi:hypothetical protein